MNWGYILHTAMALYLLAIFLWVQHAMIELTRLRNDQKIMYEDITEIKRQLSINTQIYECTKDERS